MKQRIENNLKTALELESIRVVNNSAQHAGHMESDDSGETHFALEIASKELKNIGRIAAHRKINNLLKNEFENGLHALEIKIT